LGNCIKIHTPAGVTPKRCKCRSIPCFGLASSIQPLPLSCENCLTYITARMC